MFGLFFQLSSSDVEHGCEYKHSRIWLVRGMAVLKLGPLSEVDLRLPPGHGPLCLQRVKRTTRGRVHLATLGDSGVLGCLPHTWAHEKTDLQLHVADKGTTTYVLYLLLSNRTCPSGHLTTAQQYIFMRTMLYFTSHFQAPSATWK